LINGWNQPLLEIDNHEYGALGFEQHAGFTLIFYGAPLTDRVGFSLICANLTKSACQRKAALPRFNQEGPPPVWTSPPKMIFRF
jgi:hypothetical protein